MKIVSVRAGEPAAGWKLIQGELELKVMSTAVNRRGHDGFNKLSRCPQGTSRRVSTFHAVEFSKTAPSAEGRKKASGSHRRPLVLR